MSERPYLTIREVARLWNYSVSAVYEALFSPENPLRGYQSPPTPRGVWLIETQSALKRWGNPHNLTSPKA